MIVNHKLILNKANDAVSKGNYEAYLEFCTEDTKWTFVGNQVLNGKEEIHQWMLNEYIKPPKIEVNNFIAEDDYLTALGHITVMKENGESNRYSYCDVWRFHNGKLAELTAFVI